MKPVSTYYWQGIREGREMMTKYGIEFGVEAMDGLNRLCRQFDAQNPVGQMLRGERDFWKHHIRRAAA